MDEQTFSRLKISFSRKGPGVYVSHLDAVEVLFKAFRRAGVPYAVTAGCHTRPRTILGPPLPLGHSSLCEFIHIYLSEPVSPALIMSKINEMLPEGITVFKIDGLAADFKERILGKKLLYHLFLERDSGDLAERVTRFLGNPQTRFKAHQKGVMKEFEIGNAVAGIEMKNEEDGSSSIELVFNQGGEGTPSVSKVLSGLAANLGTDVEKIIEIQRTAFLE